MDNYDGLIRHLWVRRQMQLNGYQYCTTELNEISHWSTKQVKKKGENISC